MTTFAARLKSLRESRHLIQADLAESAGVSKTFLCQLEKGHKQPSWATVLKLAEALGVGVEAFAAEEG